MESERWTELEALFEVALRLGPAERLALLEGSGVDPGLRHHVELLLNADRKAHRLLDAIVGDSLRDLMDSLGAVNTVDLR